MLNEISGDCEKIVPISGLFWSNLKFFKNYDAFDCIIMWMKSDVCSADCQ